MTIISELDQRSGDTMAALYKGSASAGRENQSRNCGDGQNAPGTRFTP